MENVIASNPSHSRIELQDIYTQLLASVTLFQCRGPDRCWYGTNKDVVPWSDVPAGVQAGNERLTLYVRNDGWTVLAWPGTLIETQALWSGYWIGTADGWKRSLDCWKGDWTVMLCFRGFWVSIAKATSSGFRIKATVADVHEKWKASVGDG